MIPVSELFFEFDVDEAMSSAKKYLKGIGHAFMGKNDYDQGFQYGKLKGVQMGRINAPKQVMRRFDNDPRFRNKLVSRGIGNAVADTAHRAANWVGQNQGIVKGAGLVGAGALASRMMARRRP